MLRQMERSAMHLLAKRGKSVRAIATELGHSPTTVARVLKEPVDRQPGKRRRRSQVDVYRADIDRWLEQGLTATKMLALVRADAERPYSGSRSVFGEVVRRMRQERTRQLAVTDVPLRFEGLPGEYLQVDWGEMRMVPFAQQAPATRYFLVCRLKYSRWSWLRWTQDMRQETLLRSLVDCFVAAGFVPWVLVFDNMKTVTSGRDDAHQPIWTQGLSQLAAEFGFHPQACDPAAGNQKGSVESLVKWVKGGFGPDRTVLDDADLAEQATDWVGAANTRPNSATDTPPLVRLPEEVAKGGALPATAPDYGFRMSASVSRESMVSAEGNRYSVPIANVGAPVTARLHRERVRIWRDQVLLADHERAPDGAHRRVVDVAHFAPLFAKKRRGQAMLYRQALLELGEPATSYVSELSRRRRERLADEMRAVYALLEQHGAAELLAAMALADETSVYGADYLRALLAAPPPPAADASASPIMATLALPSQVEVDRLLSSYEALVQIDIAMTEAAPAYLAGLAGEGAR
jgi:transposase